MSVNMVSVPSSQKREVLPNSLEQKEAAQQFLAACLWRSVEETLWELTYAMVQGAQSRGILRSATWDQLHRCIPQLSRWLLTLHVAFLIGLLQFACGHYTSNFFVSDALTSTA